MAPFTCRIKRKYRQKRVFCFYRRYIELKLIRHLGNVFSTQAYRGVTFDRGVSRSTGRENTSNMAGQEVIKCTIRCLCPPISSNTRVTYYRIASNFLRRQHTRPVEDDRVKNVSTAQRVKSPRLRPRVCSRIFFAEIVQFIRRLGNMCKLIQHFRE